MSDTNLATLNITSLSRTRRRAPRVEDFPLLWDKIEAGKSLADACAELDIHYATTRHRITANPDYVNEFAVANSLRAESYAMRAIEIAEDLMSPDCEIKVNNAKAAMPVFQWAAAQLDPQSWGKSRVEVTGKDGKDLATTNVVVFELPKNGR